MRNRCSPVWSLCFLLLVASQVPTVRGDEITYRDEGGEVFTSKGRLISTPTPFQLLERWDGQILPLHPSQITEHKQTGDPQPISCVQMGDRLSELFGKDLVRIEKQDPFVIAIVLSAPINKRAESAVQVFAKKALKFMQNVDNVFEKYAKQMEFPVRDIRFPMVLLIFEAEQDFEKYYTSTDVKGGLSAGGVVGFYSPMTNWLAVRMSSCDSFIVPLHEAIHQQMANRVVERMAPIPRWFAEGIANSFEGNGEKIDSNPAKLNVEYIQKAQQIGPSVPWGQFMGNDQSFLTDVVAGDAYTLAWCLHWTAWTQYQDGYKSYVKELSQRKPLEKISPDADEVLFERSFGISLDEMQSKYPAAVLKMANRQQVNLMQKPRKPVEQKSQLQYAIQAVRFAENPGALNLSGTVQSICPFRDMTYYLTVETTGGVYYEYLLPNMKPRQTVTLSKTPMPKPIPGMSPTDSGQYQVFVRGVPADSREAATWMQGNVPGPFNAK